MKISTITIHNFRSVEDMTLTLGDYSLLVGENNAGKSNIIDALRIFYEKGLKFDARRDFPKFDTADQESWIEIEFELSDVEYESLKDEYRLPDNRLKVRKYLKSAGGKKFNGIHGYTQDDQLAEEQFYGAKNVQQGKLGDIIYIEDVSRLSDHTKMSGPSALRDLIDDIVGKLAASSDSFARLRSEFEAFAQSFKVEETGDGTSLARLEDAINAEIAGWDTAFRLDIAAPTDSQIVKNLVSHTIEDHAVGSEMAPEQFGQGFQRHLIFTLIRLAAQYASPPQATNKKDFSPHMILVLFEEPEAFLHPPQQIELCESLRALGKREAHQVLASTHSPYFVSSSIEDLPSIVRLSRVEGKTIAGQIDREQLESIFAANLAINDIVKGTRYEADAADLTKDMEAVKYCLWLNPQRCAMFFARQVLLVEGPTECALVNYLIRTNKVQCPRGGVFVLDCIGKFNIHRFMNLLSPFRIQHSALYDGDGGAPPHELVSKLIADARTEYTSGIDTFPDDLETFLGIEKTEPHRKPQHVMLNVFNGNIGDEKLEALGAKITALLGDLT